MKCAACGHNWDTRISIATKQRMGIPHPDGEPFRRVVKRLWNTERFHEEHPGTGDLNTIELWVCPKCGTVRAEAIERG